jgi:hypothetical protein
MKLINASYYMRQLLGLYNNNNEVLDEGNVIQIESSGIRSGSIMWYLLIPSGNYYTIRTKENQEMCCSVGMKIVNDFKECESFKILNSENFTTTTSINNMFIKIVDENFQDVRFTHPVYAVLNFDERLINNDNDIETIIVPRKLGIEKPHYTNFENLNVEKFYDDNLNEIIDEQYQQPTQPNQPLVI